MTSSSKRPISELQCEPVYVVKRGKKYLTLGFTRDGFGPSFRKHQRDAVKTSIREDAEYCAKESGGRVVRLVPKVKP